ncbi:MAG: glycosyltransferase family 2 protein [Paracoccaceae bacterium]
MSICHEITLAHPRLERVRFLVQRPALSVNGDLESAFLDSATGISRHPAGRPLTSVLASASNEPDCDLVVLIRNPSLVLDAELPERIATAIAKLPEPGDWAIAGSGGLGFSDRRHLALYASNSPSIPTTGGPQPLLDPMPDLTLVNAGHAFSVLGAAPRCLDTALETVLAADGYLIGRVSIFMPELIAGIDGGLLSRDIAALKRELHSHFCDRLSGQVIPTLTGGIELMPEGPACPAPSKTPDLGEIASALTMGHCSPPSLSIVTRTRFARPHLLRRLLTSISRARPKDTPLEIVLSSDAPSDVCSAAIETLQADFPNLTLRLCHNTPTGPSRVGNLTEGLRAATMEYVAIVDDDDYLDLFAFENITQAFFLGNRPVAIASSDVHEEEWENISSPQPVLANSKKVNSYASHRWYEMFDGVNKLPVCAIIAPRDFVCRRLSSVALTHDLSEDYALFLLLLTAPDLPAIHALPDVFCHISLRGSENSVGMTDRRPWVRDIAGHLGTITTAPTVAGPGMWNQLAGRTGDGQNPALKLAVQDLNRELARRDQEIRLLRAETTRLRNAFQLSKEVIA